MRNATATTCYRPVALHLTVLILKLSEYPICPLLRVHCYLPLALHARKVHAHENTRKINACVMHAHEVHAHEVHAHETHTHQMHAMKYTPAVVRVFF
jgi:hypothetical protein